MVTLEKVTYDNFKKCISLRVSENQKAFVAPNDISLIHAYFALSEGGMIPIPYAIYAQNEMVGFIMLTFCKANPNKLNGQNKYCIWRLMIDEAHQGKGYGRSAVETALEIIRAGPLGKAQEVFLYYEPDNLIAEKLYKSFGFVETGEITDGEIKLRLSLT